MPELLHRLGTFAARRAWTVVVAWAVILGGVVGGFALGHKGLSSSYAIRAQVRARVRGTLDHRHKVHNLSY